jgi:hypothetical protein
LNGIDRTGAAQGSAEEGEEKMIKNLSPRLAEAGKIKIGGLGPERKSKENKAWRPPLKYDHFLITGTERDANGDLAIDKAMMQALLDSGYGDADGKLRAIPIVLHSDAIDEVFLTSYALYSGKRCACRGDGETALRRELDKDKQYTGQEKTIACPCEYLNAETGPKCKPNGKLFCSIAAPNSAVAGAVHIWRTTSIISVQQMIGSLLSIKNVCGTLRGIPLMLRVKPVTVEPKNSAPITVYCCHIELRAADIESVQLKAIEAAKLRHALGDDGRAYRAMLTLPAHGETIEEQKEIAEELYPEDPTNSNAPAEPTPTTRKPRGTNAADLSKQIAEKGAARDATPPPDPNTDPDAPNMQAGTTKDGRPF